MIDPVTLHFIRPWWLASLPLALLLPWAWRRLRRASGDWTRVCDPHLLRWLSVEQGGASRGRGGSWLAAVLVAVTALALSGPSWQQLPDMSFSARDARVIVLDLSASMLAQDLKPDRLTRVRFRLSDMLGEIQEGQVGLVAYAGDAYIVSPLTSDTNTIANMLPALEPGIMPVAGSRADRGLEMAAELLERAGLAQGDILLITDSVSAADIDTAARLFREGTRVSVLGVGTPKGAPIPSGNGFVKDAGGGVVIVRLESDGLRRLADAGGGRLGMLDATGPGAPSWAGQTGSSEFTRRDDAMGARWKDAGPWLVLVLLPLAALGFRRGLLFLLPLFVAPAVLLTSVPAHAGFWDDLWETRDQQAKSALQGGDPETAATLAQDPEIAGEAWFRAREFDRASEAWSGAGSADALYNRGNALAHGGDLEGALAAYDAALEVDPDMEDALFNRSLVEQMLKKEQEKKQQQQEQESSDNQDGESSEQQDQQGESQEQQGEGDPSESGSPDGEADSPERSEQDMEAAWSEEDAQAMEQWLRRIPDDAGGLLRRKFRSQHQKRGAPEDEEESW